MKYGIWVLGGAMLGLAACDDVVGASAGSAQFIQTLPEGVIEKAAPNQDLTAVKIDAVDGCYVYRHVGPVETTFLPLRTRGGNPICSRPAEPAPAPAA